MSLHEVVVRFVRFCRVLVIGVRHYVNVVITKPVKRPLDQGRILAGVHWDRRAVLGQRLAPRQVLVFVI